MLKIIFAGTPAFAVPSLQAILSSSHQCCAVYTQPDRPSGRGRHLTPSPVKQVAQTHNIPIFQPETLKDKAEQAMLSAMGADLMVVAAYGLILPLAVLSAPRLGCINVHASLLPRWRGASPIQQSLLAGDEETGVTIMQMEQGLDTGPMLTSIKYKIKSTDTAAILHDKLADLGAEALLIALSDLEHGRVKPKKQDENLVTYAPKIDKSQAQIDWSQPAVVIERQIRAYQPWPVAFTQKLDQQLRVWGAEVLMEKTDASPGQIMAATPSGIDVATGQGVLRLLKLQFPGGKPLPISDILHAKLAFFELGTYFSSRQLG